jgi:hypothetical protein
VAKVVRAQRRQSGRPHGRNPHLDPEVRGPQHATLLCREHVRVGRADRPHVGGQLLHHGARQPDAAPPGPGLGWAGVELAVDLHDDLGDVDGAAQQVDAAAAQAGQLSHAQAAVGAEQHQGSVAGADGVGQAGDLGRVEEAHLLALDRWLDYELPVQPI